MKYLLLALLISGCSTLPDILVCTSLTDTAGACTHMITGGRVDINDSNLYNGSTWNNVLASSVVVPADQWALLEQFIVMYCKQNTCPTQASKATALFDRMNKLSLNK